jgi:hypothetical protein
MSTDTHPESGICFECSQHTHACSCCSPADAPPHLAAPCPQASYVLDTEDIFYRPRGPHAKASAEAEARRQTSWAAWYDKALSGQLGQAAGAPERAKDVLEVAPLVAELASLAAAGHSGLTANRVAYPPAAAAAYQRAVAAAAAASAVPAQ